MIYAPYAGKRLWHLKLPLQLPTLTSLGHLCWQVLLAFEATFSGLKRSLHWASIPASGSAAADAKWVAKSPLFGLWLPCPCFFCLQQASRDWTEFRRGGLL